MSGITEQEILDFLKAVETGEITVTPVGLQPQNVYCGDAVYDASNGWRIIVFNDCNTFDYIDRIEKPDGTFVDYQEISTKMPLVENYVPSEDIAWNKWRIPGYLSTRCNDCGTIINTKSVPVDANETLGRTDLCDVCGGQAKRADPACANCGRQLDVDELKNADAKNGVYTTLDPVPQEFRLSNKPGFHCYVCDSIMSQLINNACDYETAKLESQDQPISCPKCGESVFPGKAHPAATKLAAALNMPLYWPINRELEKSKKIKKEKKKTK